MYIFDNNKYISKPTGYNYTIKYRVGSLIFEIGELPIATSKKPEPSVKIKKRNHINVRGVRKEELEYHYGIYRMFPCGKQFQYHMQYLHVPNVYKRRIY